MAVQRFLIARNPDPDSRLPYLVRLPIGDGLVLKVRDTWPRTARVYCARADRWPPDAEVIEDVGVVLCRRRGPAIDIVLDRPSGEPVTDRVHDHPWRPGGHLLANT